MTTQTSDIIRKVVYQYRELELPYRDEDRLGELNTLARDGWDIAHVDTQRPEWLFLLRRECAVVHMNVVKAGGDNGA